MSVPDLTPTKRAAIREGHVGPVKTLMALAMREGFTRDQAASAIRWATYVIAGDPQPDDEVFADVVIVGE